MTLVDQTICAVATPPGEGALGIVRLSGGDALALLRAASGRRRFRPRQLRLCRIRAASGEVLDQVLACYQPAPRSYTGEESVEIYAHGGSLNLRRILARLCELGARPAEPGEFTRRAFLNGRLDLTQAEAVAAIVGARSERALRNAQALQAGRLGAEVEAVRAGLLALAAELEAAIDFSEEVPPQAGALARCLEAESAVAELAASYARGRRLDQARVGLVGEVNAGKSSLFNRLLGTERALVASEPGTTRDYLVQEVEWRGQRLTLLDSAGLRSGELADALERAGLALAEPALASCDLLLLVHDLSREGPSPPLPESLQAVPRLEVGSKADLAGHRRPELELRTSALTGEGIEGLRAAILERLDPAAGEPEPERVLVTEERQWLKLVAAGEALAEARGAISEERPPELVAEHLRAATRTLAELTGELSSDSVLDAVFQRFCIGK